MSTRVPDRPGNALFAGLRFIPIPFRPPIFAATFPTELTENATFIAFISSFFASSSIAEENLDEFVRQMKKFPSLDALVFESPARVRYPPKNEWLRALLKRLIGKIHELGFDPSDVLYESLCASMTFDSENGQGDCFFRIFPDFFDPNFSQASYILLKQSVHHISHGTTGLSCWRASSVLANFFAHFSTFSNASHALELGAGCGLAGISFAALNPSAKVTLTDAHPAVLRQLRENVALNFDCSRDKEPSISVECLDWTDYERQKLPKGTDLIIAADVIFDPSLFPPFAQLLQHFLFAAEDASGDVVALICCTVRDKGTVGQFLRVIESHKISIRAQYNCYFRSGACGHQIAFDRRKCDKGIEYSNENDPSEHFLWHFSVFPNDLSCNPSFPVVIFEFVKS